MDTNMNNRPHYVILDGLRGIAAIGVLCYHLFEAIAFAAGAPEQNMYHGFLAVDFFFILSGFVMGYAYDLQWGTMDVKGFLRRRLIRLHPMVCLGVVFGLIAFCIQGCTDWEGNSVAPLSILATTLLSLFLIPSVGQSDVRGNTELFPLNGPLWSLFFEYIGSFLYALLLRRLSDKWLTAVVAVSLIALGINGWMQGEGWIAYGWSSEPVNAMGGLLRLCYGYPAGLLMARLFRKCSHRSLPSGTFLLCSLSLVALLCIPNMQQSLVFQLLCVGLFFPAIVWTGACGSVSGCMEKGASLLGRLSYPLYAIHYPLIYLYIHCINKGIHPFGTEEWTSPVGFFILAIAAGLISMKWYDEPVRRALGKK